MPIDNQGVASRILPFPLKESIQPIPEISDGEVVHQTVDFFPEDSDEQIDVTMRLSLNEYVALASAIDIGRDIGYGENSQEIWWLWIKAILGMPTCEQIIDCIENDADVRQALTDYLFSQGYAPVGSGGTPLTPTAYNNNPLLIDGSTIVDCGNDNLFGAITQFVDFINRRIVDVFEIIESETNIIERTQIALEAVPITDTLAADSAAAFADQLIEEIAEGYDAAFTEELEDEYRCDLFCLVKDTCEMDFQTFADYFNNRIGNTPPSVQFSEYIEWFITGDFVGSNIVDAAYSLVCAALSYQSAAFGINIAALLTSINSALNDPNSDWLTLCEDCGGDFPDLVNTVCWAGGSSGVLVQENADTWTLESTGGDFQARISAVGGVAFRIMTIEFIIAPAFEYFEQSATGCGAHPANFGWNNLIDDANIISYFLSSTNAWKIRFTVSEL